MDRHKLRIPVVARYIRFYPTKHILWDSLRVEVYGIFKGELILSKYNKRILKCYTAVSSVKVNAKTTKGVVGSSQVTVPWLQDFREIWEKFTVRRTHFGFHEFICLFHLLKDYLSRVSRALLFFLRQIFSKQLYAFIEKLQASVWHSLYTDVTHFKLFSLFRTSRTWMPSLCV